MLQKPKIRFENGEWLDKERINMGMQAIDDCVDAANAAEQSAKDSAKSAADSAQSTQTAIVKYDALIDLLNHLPDGQNVSVQVAQNTADIAALQEASYDIVDEIDDID